MKTNFETEVCSRCNGSGKYSFCERYADRCFKCAGAGRTYSKRGAAARAFYEKLCTIPASQVKVGDRVAAVGATHNGTYNYVGTVTAISTEECVTETTRTLREDGSFHISNRYGTIDTAGQIKYTGYGSTVEFKGHNKGDIGTTLERYTAYTFSLTSKYGNVNTSGSREIRVYPVDNTAQVAEAMAYEATLTKQGKIRKTKGAK